MTIAANIFCDNSTKSSTTALILIATMFLCVSFVYCEDNGTEVGLKNSKRNAGAVRVCGTKLVNTLKKLCNHCYREPQLIRSIRASEHREVSDGRQEFLSHMKRLDELQSESDESSSEEIDSYIDKRLANRQMKTSGIANKCCINQCGWTDLRSYCCKRPQVPVEQLQ